MKSDRTLQNRSVILVVEDDPPLRELYRTALTSAGYAVVAVEDGVDALRFVETQTPAAVVLDLGLPRLHGLDVYRELAAQGMTSYVPIIVVTGDAAGISEKDFACVIRKPTRPDSVVEAVHNCLASRKNRSTL